MAINSQVHCVSSSSSKPPSSSLSLYLPLQSSWCFKTESDQLYLKMEYYFALLSRSDGSFHIHAVFTWIKHTAVFKLEAIYLLGLHPLKQFCLISLLTFLRVSYGKMYTASCLCQMQIIRTFLPCSDSVCVGEWESEREWEIGWMKNKTN